MRRLAAFLCDRRGAAAIEFALVALPFIMLLMGLMEFGRALYVKSALNDAVDRAQRVVLIEPAITASALEIRIRDRLDGLEADRLVVTDGAVSASGIDYRVVSLVYDLTLVMPTPLGQTVSLGAERRIVQAP